MPDPTSVFAPVPDEQVWLQPPSHSNDATADPTGLRACRERTALAAATVTSLRRACGCRCADFAVDMPGCAVMADPVSWLLIQSGWKVYASDGSEVGEVDEVAGDDTEDIFDGLAIAMSSFGKPRYVPAEQVAG